MIPFDSQLPRHPMHCVRMAKKEWGELEFEFLCYECGFRAALAFSEVRARRDLNVSHAYGPAGPEPVYISYGEDRVELPLPQSIRDFLDYLDAKIAV